jgi:ssDNA-binding Zn-finger/Zn-ribbon topoisomerase 1
MSEEHNQFGECPECGRSGEYRNIYRHHFVFCDEHRLVWLAGSNLVF